MARAGIKHVYADNPNAPSLSARDFAAFVGDGRVTIDAASITEKTDGIAIIIGYDETGLYIIHSGSRQQRLYSPEDIAAVYAARDPAKRDAARDAAATRGFSNFLSYLKTSAPAFVDVLRRAAPAYIRGELFWKDFAESSASSGVRFNKIVYDDKLIGRRGAFVLHTRLPDNAWLTSSDIARLRSASSDEFRVLTDEIETGGSVTVDATEELAAFRKLDLDLIDARTTPRNKEAKLAEIEKFNAIKRSLSSKLRNALNTLNVKPKWGEETEGFIIHHPRIGPVKIISDTFASRAPAAAFRAAPVTEGGNVRLAGIDKKPVPIVLAAIDRAAVIRWFQDFLIDLNRAVPNLNVSVKDAIGSAAHLFDDRIDDDALARSYQKFGDIDFVVKSQAVSPGDLKNALHYARDVVGSKVVGRNVLSIVNVPEVGPVQVDFMFPASKEAGEAAWHLMSSDREDAAHGLKGVIRLILINQMLKQVSERLGQRVRLSSTGLNFSAPDNEKNIVKTLYKLEDIAQTLFNDSSARVDSTLNILNEIQKRHGAGYNIQQLIDDFATSVEGLRSMPDEKKHATIALVTKSLRGERLDESAETIDVAFTPLVGFSPIPHMGHAIDLGGAFQRVTAHVKVLAISTKNAALTFDVTRRVLLRQWKSRGVDGVQVVPSASVNDTITLVKTRVGNRAIGTIYLIVGADRVGLAENIKKSILEGRTELSAERVEIITPEDGSRTHGFSGTKMRAAAANGDFETFWAHVGRDTFSENEAKELMRRVAAAIESGVISLRR